MQIVYEDDERLTQREAREQLAQGSEGAPPQDERIGEQLFARRHVADRADLQDDGEQTCERGRIHRHQLVHLRGGQLHQMFAQTINHTIERFVGDEFALVAAPFQHDRFRVAALQHGEVGRGLNDYDSIFRLLAECGFGGWISNADIAKKVDAYIADAQAGNPETPPAGTEMVNVSDVPVSVPVSVPVKMTMPSAVFAVTGSEGIAGFVSASVFGWGLGASEQAVRTRTATNAAALQQRFSISTPLDCGTSSAI